MKPTLIFTAALCSMGLTRNPASRPVDATPSFALTASGAVSLAFSGEEVRYGLSPATAEENPVLVVSLGESSEHGSLGLYTAAGLPLQPGRYPVRSEWPGANATSRWFHLCLVAGSMAKPLGVFHSESGWVTITRPAPGRVDGEFEIQARGFLVGNDDDENQWVTVRGRFTAQDDSAQVAEGLAASPVQ